MTRPRRSLLAVRSLRGLLILYLFFVLAPVLLVQLWVYERHLESQRRAELRANVEIARAVSSAFESYILDLRSQELSVGRAFLSFTPFAPPDADHYLASIVKDSPTLSALSWVQPSGLVCASDQPDRVGEDWSRTEWFRRLALGREEWVVAHIPPRADPEEAAFSVWQAIRESGTLRGVVVAEVKAAHLTTVLDVWRSDRGAIALVDSNGWLVYRQPSVPVPESDRNWGRRFSVYKRALEGLELAGVEYIPYEHRSRILAAVPIPSIGWAAGAGRAEEDALAPVVQDMWGSFLLLFVVAMAAAILVAVASQRITGPLSHLHSYARAVGRGEFHRELTVTGPAELEALAEAFARMAGEIQQRQQTQTEQARLLDAIIEENDTWMAYLDRDLRFVRVNRALAASADKQPEDFLGKPFLAAFPEQREAAALCQYAIATGEPVFVPEFACVPRCRPDTGTIYLRGAAVPVRTASGDAAGLVVTAVDITSHVHTRERAVAAERARAELAEHLSDEIAHRVKNNLAMISGLLQMQAIRQHSPEVAAALRDAVARVRTFAHLHEQMYAGQSADLDLLEAVRRVADMNQEIFRAEDRVEIRAVGESVLLTSRAATNLCVITNELITNALKHGRPAADGLRHVEVRVGREAANVVLEVWNSGNPVPEGFVPNGHAGLGLLLVAELVESQYGGSFTLSAARHGTLARISVAASQCLPAIDGA